MSVVINFNSMLLQILSLPTGNVAMPTLTNESNIIVTQFMY